MTASGFARPPSLVQVRLPEASTLGVKAVSYTHLDVYKRQALSTEAQQLMSSLWTDIYSEASVG